ncbi:MAG: YkgJ family cysteine cluster protein [Planctomycetota bacterium]|jgi:Fe-S-cluster containining protein
MSDELKNLQRLKEEVLKDYPRMDMDSRFRFSCHPKVSCFNHCCGDVNIFLTPYDVMRMKNRLGISSTEFMNKFTALPIDRNQRFPVILFRMKDEEGKPCPFVDQEKGCTIYEDRPWSCRMYPLGMASPKEGNVRGEQEFYFLMKEDVCRGHEEDHDFTVREWLENQGIAEYDRKGKEFKELTLHDFFEKGEQLSPQQMEMFYTACYDLDKFREFIFDTSFLERFHVEDTTVKEIKEDDEALLSFAFRWLRYCLFGEPTLKVVDKRPRGKEAGKDEK